MEKVKITLNKLFPLFTSHCYIPRRIANGDGRVEFLPNFGMQSAPMFIPMLVEDSHPTPGCHSTFSFTVIVFLVHLSHMTSIIAYGKSVPCFQMLS